MEVCITFALLGHRIFQLSQTAVVKVEMSSTFPTVPINLNNSQP